MAAITATTPGAHSPQLRQMSSDFMARRKIYEQDDTHMFYTTVTKVATARCGSPQFFNATPKPAPRKFQPSSPVPEALPRVRSEESLRIAAPRLSLEMRPSVPRRSSSIRSRTNHRSKDLRLSIHRQSSQQASYLDSSAITQEPTENNSVLASRFSELTDLRDDSPLGYTLNRKRSSLPPTEYKPDFRLSLHEPRILERDSCISHRDRESFLASFPQPPKSSHSRQVHTHRRNSSSQNYSLFPRSPPAHEQTFDKDGNRRSPRQSQEKQSCDEPCALPEIPDELATVQPSGLVAPMHSVTGSYSPLTYAHPNMSFSNPNFTDANLRLDLGRASMDSALASSRFQTEHVVRSDASHILRKRLANKVASRWAFGGLQSEQTNHAQQSSGIGKTEPQHSREVDEKSMDMLRHSVDIAGRPYDDNDGGLGRGGSKRGLRKKASSIFGLKEKNSSMSMNHLLDKTSDGRTKWKKSLLRKVLCW